jgi:lambda repressor-like predicted transcriptional regulator
VNPDSVAQALKEACSIVDEILPLEEFGRGKSAADRTQLRSVSLPLVLTALLGGSDLTLPEADDEEALTSGAAARLLGVESKVVIEYAVRGLLRSSRTPGGRWRFKKGDIRRFKYPEDPNEGMLRSATGDDIIRMRDDQKMSWAAIAARTGLSAATLRNTYRKSLAEQSLVRLEEFKAASATDQHPDSIWKAKQAAGDASPAEQPREPGG